MNKKDLYIKEELQKDKEISNKANRIFDNFKEEFIMENNNNEKKVIKISLAKFTAIAAAIAIVAFMSAFIYAYKTGGINKFSGKEIFGKNDKKIDEIAKELFEQGNWLISHDTEHYKNDKSYNELEFKEIDGMKYAKTETKYSEVEEKFGEVFAEEALKNALALNYRNVDGTLYAIYKAGGTPWTLKELSVEKKSEESGVYTYIAKYKMIYSDDPVTKAHDFIESEFKIKEIDGAYKIIETNFLNMDKSSTGNTQNNQDEGKYDSLYKKYSDLHWIFKEERKTELEWLEDKITIEDGSVYVHANGKKEKVNTINGTAKYLNGWVDQTLQYVYVITEEGNVWKSIIHGKTNSSLNKEFEKINISEKIIDMTNGNDTTRVTEPPYFLLDNGELVNENGSKYEELEGRGIVKKFGTAFRWIYIAQDSTMLYFDNNKRDYISVKDTEGNQIRMKYAYVQLSTDRSKIIEENEGQDRFIVIDMDGEMYYFDDDYSNSAVILKKYKKAEGKIVKSTSKIEENDGYNGILRSIKVEFTDGTDLILYDAEENFFE